MSDAAQKAVEKALYGEFVEILGEHLTEDQVRSHVGCVARTVLAVLSETHAVVELPKLTPDENGFVQWGAEGDDHVWTSRGTKRVRVYIDDPRFPVEGAQEFAAAVLAIARVAEGGGSRG